MVYAMAGANGIPEWAATMRDARVARGLSQTELAAMIGVDQTHISRWERGRVGQLTHASAVAVARALGLDVAVFLPEQTPFVDRLADAVVTRLEERRVATGEEAAALAERVARLEEALARLTPPPAARRRKAGS